MCVYTHIYVCVSVSVSVCIHTSLLKPTIDGYFHILAIVNSTTMNTAFPYSLPSPPSSWLFFPRLICHFPAWKPSMAPQYLWYWVRMALSNSSSPLGPDICPFSSRTCCHPSRPVTPHLRQLQSQSVCGWALSLWSGLSTEALWTWRMLFGRGGGGEVLHIVRCSQTPGTLPTRSQWQFPRHDK